VFGFGAELYRVWSVAEDGRWTKAGAVGFPVALPGGAVLSILCGGSERWQLAAGQELGGA
jgi:hypothetical protein